MLNVPVEKEISVESNFFLRKNAFTLVEIIVGSLILTLIVASFLSVALSIQRLNRRSLYRLQAINVARQVLEGLYQEVRQDTWNTSSNGLRQGQNISGGSFIVDDINYTAQYNVQYIASNRLARVDLTVQWQE